MSGRNRFTPGRGDSPWAVYRDSRIDESAQGKVLQKKNNIFFCIFIIAKFSESSKRFLTRGIDDSGAVANSVETETFLLDQEGRIAAHCQLRGSVPVFWEQPGINFGQHKCDIIRKTEGSLSAAKRKEFSTAVV